MNQHTDFLFPVLESGRRGKTGTCGEGEGTFGLGVYPSKEYTKQCYLIPDQRIDRHWKSYFRTAGK